MSYSEQEPVEKDLASKAESEAPSAPDLERLEKSLIEQTRNLERVRKEREE